MTMVYLPCTVAPGLRPQEAGISIYSSTGEQEHFPLDRGMLHRIGDQDILPTYLQYIDWDKRIALVALPVETDSGTHSMFLPLDDLIWPDTPPTDPAARRIAAAVTAAQADHN